jgi:hypothetical protein
LFFCSQHFHLLQNSHIKESNSPTQKETKDVKNYYTLSNQLPSTFYRTKQNKTKKWRKLSTADKCISIQVSSSLMNEMNTVSNNYYKTYRLQIVWLFFVVIQYQPETRTYHMLKMLKQHRSTLLGWR